MLKIEYYPKNRHLFETIILIESKQKSMQFYFSTNSIVKKRIRKKLKNLKLKLKKTYLISG